MTSLLLAKTPVNPNEVSRPETLAGHTEWVLEAAKNILDQIRDDLPKTVNFERLRLLVLCAAILHDLGKANNIFQDMLNKNRRRAGEVHPLRHEVLSALLIASIDTPLKNWLRGAFDQDDTWIWMLAWIAGGHHLKLHKDRPSLIRKESDKLVRTNGIPREFVFYGSRVYDVLEMISLIANIGHAPKLTDVTIAIDEGDDLESLWHGSLVAEFVVESAERSRTLTESQWLMLALSKAVVIAADVAGSALSKHAMAAEHLVPASVNMNPASWIKTNLQQVLFEFDLQGIIDERLQGRTHPCRICKELGLAPEIEQEPKTDCLRPFQKKVRSSRDRVTLVVAGCGTGKTLAAYAWAKHHAANRKLIFCYPTTGTATAGFDDYLLAQTDLERALIHGKSTVDMERMLGTQEDDPVEDNQRLESIKAWGQQAIVCTVDTVLGLIQNQRRALFSFPAILRSAIVFDEIHNYDAKMFGALLTFLKTLPELPILLMSASIPQSRIDALKASLGKTLSAPIQGEKDMEELPRYRLAWRATSRDCWPDVLKTLSQPNSNKVLWVCNTVKDATDRYEEALQQCPALGVRPILYHSRFRYKDRVRLQEYVIHSFKCVNTPCLVIATQVCEMSLDISAALMVTALAPFPALMQRLGRLNRHGEIEGGGRCLLHDFSCRDGKPYRTSELLIARENILPFTNTNKPLSQTGLANALKNLPETGEIKHASAWLGEIADGNAWESDQRPFREGGASLMVLLESDRQEIMTKLNGARPTSQNVAAWTIPMWYKPGVPATEKLGGYPVIRNEWIEYDEQRGARWRALA